MNPSKGSDIFVQRLATIIIIICLAATIATGFLLYQDKQKKNFSHFSKQQTDLVRDFKATSQLYQLITANFFQYFLNTPETLDLLSKIKNSSSSNLDKLRVQLYHSLYPVYNRLQNIYLIQLHFYTQEGKSFLRFHRPTQYGDSLVLTKIIVEESITKKQPLHGFEKGFPYGAMFFSFPLFFKGEYLGGVTISIPADTIINSLTEIAPDREYAFLFQKETPNPIIERTQNPNISGLSTSILQMGMNALQVISPKQLSEDARAFNALLREDPKTWTDLAARKNLAINRTVNKTPYTLCMLPLFDAQGICTGYLVSYVKDWIPKNDMKTYLFLSLLWFSVVSILLSILFKLGSHNQLIRKEKQTLFDIFQIFPEGILILDSEGAIVETNPKAIKLLGYQKEELTAKRAHKLLLGKNHIHDWNQESNSSQKTQIEKEYKQEKIFKKKDGTFISVELFYGPLGHNKKSMGSFLAFRDLTATKNAEAKLKASEKLQYTLMESVPIGLVIIDEKTRIIEYANAEATRLLDLPLEKITGNICHKFICPAEIDTCPISDLGQSVDNSDRVLLKHGAIPVPVTKTVRQVEIQGKSKILECFIDISKRKKTEEMAMLKENQAKKDFLVNMSHGIRTPLNAILGMTHLILKTELTELQRNYLTKSHRAAKSLIGTVNDILDFSKIESKTTEMEDIEFDLLDVLDNVLYIIEMRLIGKKIEFTAGIDKEVPNRLKGDPLKLEKVLINLAENAAKFTEQGFIQIWVSIDKIEDKDVRLKFSVQDTGFGIEPKKQKKLFTPFVQNDPSIARNYGGTGLGLSIADRIVKLMGGTIEVTSQINMGSNFFFTIPFQLSSPRKPPVNLEEQNVLIVEPKENTRKLLIERIGFLGGNPQAVENGTQALEKLSRGTIQILITCANLPDMPYEKLREGNKIPTIVMAGMDQKGATTNPKDKKIFVSHPLGFQSMAQGLRLLLTDRPEARQRKTKKLFPLSKVLVVEDNLVNQQMTQTLLQDLGLSVITVEDGNKAIQYVEKENFDLILMDLQMPGMNGFEAARKIRSQSKIKNMPILAMTISATYEDRMEVFASGMDDLIIKPIERNRLVQLLKKWLPLSDKDNEDYGSEEMISYVSGAEEEILDTEEALPRFANREDLFAKALHKVADQYKDVAEQLNTTLKKGEMEEGRFLAHTLRGVMGNMGAKKIFEATSRLEDAFAHDQKEDARDILASLSGMMKTFVDYVQKNYCDTSEQTPLQTAQQKDTDLEDLIKILENRRPADCQKTIRLLKQINKTKNNTLDIDDLIRLIENYEFDKAIEMVNALI